MRIFRRIESGVGKALLGAVVFLMATLIVAVIIGVANSNLFWGEANQYGRVDVPGHEVMHLPTGKAQVTAAAALPGRGNETPELLVPKISLTVLPVGFKAPVEITQDLGSSVNADDKEVDTQRRIAYVQIHTAGDYRVIAKGDFTGYGVNGQLWLGYEPGYVHGPEIWLVAALIVLALAAVIFLVSRLRRRSRDTSASP